MGFAFIAALAYRGQWKEGAKMAAPRKLPSVDQLQRMVESGMTHQQIAEAITAETGEPVTRGAISAALSRAGKTSDKPRYSETVPWRVKVQHLTEYAPRMLRLLGRRNKGIVLSHKENQRLVSWLEMLDAEGVVVAYDPDNDEQGFHYIDASFGDGGDVPIRTQVINTRKSGLA